MNLAAHQINLFNPALAPRRDWLAPRMLGLYGMACASLLVLSYAALALGTQSLREQQARALQERSARQTQLAALAKSQPPQVPSDLLRGERDRLAASLERVERSAKLVESGHLGSVRGFAEYLRAFARQSGQGVWLTGFTVRHPHGIQIAGGATRAEAVPEFLDRLAREPLFKGLAMSTLDMARPAATPTDRPEAGKTTAGPATSPAHLTFRIGSGEGKS